PVDGAAQAVLKAGARPPFKEVGRPRRIELATRLPVGLGWVEANVAREPSRFRNMPNQIRDADFLAAAEVDRLGSVVAFERSHDAFRAIAREQKLACRRARAPYVDVRVAALACFDALADQRWDHVRAARIEVVTWPVQVGW